VGSYAGFEVWGAGNNKQSFAITGAISYDRGANLNHQASALRIDTSNAIGQIEIQFSGLLNNGTARMPPLSGTQAPDGIDLIFNGMGAGYNPAGVVSGTVTPDPYYARTAEYQIIGATTFADVQYGGISAGWLYQGMRMTLIIVQGATPYAISWGSTYNVIAAPSASANSTSVMEFVYDGAHWQQAVPAASPSSAWTDYTPTITADSGNPSNLTIVAARYLQVGKTCQVRVSIAFGSNPNGGGGTWHVSLPTPASTSGWQDMLANLYCASYGIYIGYAGIDPSVSNTIATIFMPTSASNNVMQGFRSCDSSGLVSTGIPYISGQYSVQKYGNLGFWGTNETA
jgi:hypothetical protein